MSKPEPERIDPNKLRPGPIRHKSLPPKLLKIIRSVYEVVGPYLNTTLEQFEIGFMREMRPEKEVAVWCKITTAWIGYHEQFLDEQLQSDKEETKLLGALIAISSGVEDVEKLAVPIEVGRRLMECYDGLSED
jgi:hypothetical protein